tara:strand:- start:420 stop:833 length:414 start_codon:yes stop_codon:yes gene_type:complete
MDTIKDCSMCDKETGIVWLEELIYCGDCACKKTGAIGIDMNGKFIYKQQNEEKANNDCIGEECDGHCNADDVEECDDCGIKLRIGSECDPSDHSIFNGMCDDCREMEIEKELVVEAITRQIDEYVKEHPEADIGKFN